MTEGYFERITGCLETKVLSLSWSLFTYHIELSMHRCFFHHHFRSIESWPHCRSNKLAERKGLCRCLKTPCS